MNNLHTTLRIVMCDANREELERYKKICQEICEAASVKAVINAFSDSQALLFEMNDQAFSSRVRLMIIDPDGGCEAAASRLRKEGYGGVILYLSRSTKKEYYQQAFNANALNYVEKGDMKRFAEVFKEALRAARQLDSQHIMVSNAGEYRQIYIHDIYYFETTTNHMVCVWHAEGKFTFQSSLFYLENRLREHGFFRAHRSYLIALDAVRRISYDEVTLSNGRSIPLARGAYAMLKRIMADGGSLSRIVI